MVYSEEDVRRGQIIFQIACIRGHVLSEAQSDVNRFREWWENLSDERRGAIFEDCARVLENSKQEAIKKTTRISKRSPGAQMANRYITSNASVTLNILC